MEFFGFQIINNFGNLGAQNFAHYVKAEIGLFWWCDPSTGLLDVSRGV